jgi:hypothetical protein
VIEDVAARDLAGAPLDQDMMPERIAREPPVMPTVGEVRQFLAVLDAASEY